MAYDEEEARRSRVVVETPNERREVVHSQSVRDNSGISAGMVGVLAVVAIALITMPAPSSELRNDNPHD